MYIFRSNIYNSLLLSHLFCSFVQVAQVAGWAYLKYLGSPMAPISDP